MGIADFRLTRDGVCRTFKLTPDELSALESAGVLAPEADNTFDAAGVAAALFRFGLDRAQQAEQKVVAVAATLQDVLPLLQRLSGLADAAGLEGEARDKAMAELSVFFNGFAGLMTRATTALNGEG